VVVSLVMDTGEDAGKARGVTMVHVDFNGRAEAMMTGMEATALLDALGDALWASRKGSATTLSILNTVVSTVNEGVEMGKKDDSDGYKLGGRPGREHPNGWDSQRPTDGQPLADRDVIRPPDRTVASNRDDK
jgi:hypothetical protein